MDPTEEGTVADTVSDSMNPDFKKMKLILKQNQIRPEYSHLFFLQYGYLLIFISFCSDFFLLNGHIYYINEKL